MRKKFGWLSIAVVLMALSAWSPWPTQGFAEARAAESFNQAWLSVIDGCGTNCKGCGAIKSQRVPFGH